MEDIRSAPDEFAEMDFDSDAEVLSEPVEDGEETGGICEDQRDDDREEEIAAVISDGEKVGDDQSFRLKYLGEEIEVSREEVITLAQKGRDYDRIRVRADELAAAMEKNREYASFIEERAKSLGLNADEFIDRQRAAQIAADMGVDEKTALMRIELQRREKAVAAREAGAAAKSTAVMAAERRDKETREFLAEHGDVDPKSIPQEVWGEVSKGRPLLAAYTGYENRRLKARLAERELREENRAKASGSLASVGSAGAWGEIEADWYGK